MADVKRNDQTAAQRAKRGAEGLSVQAEVHDRHQLELRFNYAVGERGRSRYFVDAFFFIPRNVGLNRSNYSREQFYADFTALMRVDAASLPLDALSDAANPSSPLSRIVALHAALRTSPRPPQTRPLSVHARLYANLYVAGVRMECRRLEKLLARYERERVTRAGGRPSLIPDATRSHDTIPAGRTLDSLAPRVTDPDGAFERDVVAALGRMREALKAYRSARGALWPFERLCHQGVAEAMRGADEYMSLALEERLAQLSASLGDHARRFDGTAFVARVRAHLVALAAEEAAVRGRYGYLTRSGQTLEVDPESSDPAARAGIDPGEYFTYRASLLKKGVQQALYLNLRASRGDMFVRNAVGAVAAALAAIWALATQIPAYVVNLPPTTKALFFTGAVLAYVMKDRIKAITSEALLKRARTYDHAHQVYGEQLPDAGIGDFVARSAEAMRFVSSDEVPAEVRAVRLQRRTVLHAEAAAEEVIHYRKRLDAGTEQGRPGLPDGYRVRDILRMNLRHFLVRLDDPMDRVDCFDTSTGGFVRAELPKVYRVNLVVRVRRESDDADAQERYAHLRVVLNKDGIVRAEQIHAAGVTITRKG
ncbi:MAG: hypothetical protein U0326_04280 [Polyangiales bacterium]